MSRPADGPSTRTGSSVLDGLRRFAHLPDWLEDAVAPQALQAALARAAPEVADDVVAFEAERLRLKEGASTWRASYCLVLSGAGGEPRRLRLSGTLQRPSTSGHHPGEATACGPIGAPGWRVRLPELGLSLAVEGGDAALEALPDLTEPDRARPLLEAAIRSGGTYPDLRIERCTAEVMRYKPGSRCTVRYQLVLGPGAEGRGWPDVVVAKTYHGDKGANAYAGMRALWDTPLSRGGVVSLAAPLAYLPEQRVLVQGPVREDRVLKDLVRATFAAGADPPAVAALDEALARTAAGLAALHRSEAWHGELVTFEDERAELGRIVGRLGVPLPEVDGAGAALLARIDEVADRTPADPPRPSHTSFRPAQVLLHGDEVGFIDFDGFGRAEPGLDLGLFLATTASVAVRAAPTDRRASALATVDALISRFIRRYQDDAPVSTERVALWQALALLTAVLHCWTKVRPDRLEPNLLLLQHHVRSVGLT
jgi:hypothetical protein